MAIWRGLVGESDGDNFNGFVVEVVMKGEEANVDLDIVMQEGVLLLDIALSGDNFSDSGGVMSVTCTTDSEVFFLNDLTVHERDCLNVFI